jgi:type II secretory pathway pseudopilin PulG
MRSPNDRRGAFTLTELLIAVLVLLVVIAATARIFGTAQRVTSVGEANASILQEATAIERRLRDDLSRLSDQGYMAIRNVAVRNDINDVSATNQKELLNPDLPFDAVLRLDQLVFFTQGAQDTLDFIGGVNLVNGAIPAGMTSRVMYGHGVQVLDRVKQAQYSGARFNPDPQLSNGRYLSPWVVDTTAFDGLSLTSTSTGPTVKVNGTQPSARDWILSRRSILLADDGGDPSFLGIAQNTAQLDANSFEWMVKKQPTLSWFPSGVLQPSPEVLSGRFDVCAMQPDDIERVLCRFEGTNPGASPARPLYAPWIVVPGTLDLPTGMSAGFGPVRQRVINATFGLGVTQNQAGTNVPIGLACWPRVEREPPTTDKSDQMLTSGMIGGNCSSFIVEWCWRDGVARVIDESGQVGLARDPLNPGGSDVALIGYTPVIAGRQDWIGLPDDAFGLRTPTFQRRGTLTLQDTGAVRWPLYAPSIEGPAGAQVLPMVGAGIPPDKAWCYTSVFGFNGSEPTYGVTVLDSSVSPPQQRRVRVPRLDYCPRPSALRISMTLHDPDHRIDGGREFTFVIDLPERSIP